MAEQLVWDPTSGRYVRKTVVAKPVRGTGSADSQEANRTVPRASAGAIAQAGQQQAQKNQVLDEQAQLAALWDEQGIAAKTQIDALDAIANPSSEQVALRNQLQGVVNGYLDFRSKRLSQGDLKTSDEVALARLELDSQKQDFDQALALAKFNKSGTGGGSKGPTTADRRLAWEKKKYADAGEQKILDDAAKASAKITSDNRARTSGNQAATDLQTTGQGLYDKTTKGLESYYGGVQTQQDSARKNELANLVAAIGQGKGNIDAASQQFQTDMVNPTAYDNTALVNLSQQENPLIAALLSQGASTSQVEGQRTLDTQLSSQLAQLLKNQNSQLATGQQNYIGAVRNAGAGATMAGKQFLDSQQPVLSAGINSQYDQMGSALAGQRLGAQTSADNTLAEWLQNAAKIRAETLANYGTEPVAEAAAAAPPASGQVDASLVSALLNATPAPAKQKPATMTKKKPAVVKPVKPVVPSDTTKRTLTKY